MNGLLTHFKIDFKNGIRDNTMILMNYLFPLGFYVLMGLLMPKLNGEFLNIMIPGMLAFSILAATVLTIPNMIVSARENNIYRSYKIYGVSISNILILIMGTTAVHALIVTLIIILTAPGLFNSVSVVNILALIGVALAFIFTCASLSTLIGVCCKNTKVTTLWSQLLFIPSVILGGIMIPLEILPKELEILNKIIPTTYATVAMREWGMGQAQPLDAIKCIGILLALGIIATLLSHYFFQWDDNNPRESNKLYILLILAPIITGVIIL